MPPPTLEMLDVRTRERWRAWLQKRHASSPGIWFVFHFTPRKPTSKWSDSNRRRWAELKATGALAAAGLAAAPTGNRYAPKPNIPVLPAYIARAFKTNRKAWTFLGKLSPTSRRQFVVWIHIAKRPDTQQKRLRTSIQLLAGGRPLGLK